MNANSEINLKKFGCLVEDYRTLKPERSNKDNLTYLQLTVAAKMKLAGMLKSGHRLCGRKGKKLIIVKQDTDAGFYRYMNPFPLARLIKATLRAVEAFNILPEAMHMVTVIEKKWNTTLEDFDLNLVAIRAKICQELRDKNALMMVEAAFLEDGVISMHCQGISWGLTQADIKNLNTRFSGVQGATGFENGFVGKGAYDPVGAIAYMFKPPTYGYQKPLYPLGHKTKRLPNRDCYELYRAIRRVRPKKPLTYFDFMIGVGEGVAMKAAIMRFLGH